MPATRASPAEEDARAAAWAPLWACGLPLHTLLEREARLRDHAWGAAHRRAVLLRDATDGAASSCSCEVYDCDGSGVFLLATLYTDADRRGRGLAGELMRRVEAALAGGEVDSDGRAALGFPHGTGSEPPSPAYRGMLLFSEIGPVMYERLGYTVCGDHSGSESRAPNDVTLPPADGSDGGGPALPPHASLTLVPDVAHLAPALAAWAAHHAAAERGGAAAAAPEVVRLPVTPGRLDWHAEAERHRAQWALSLPTAAVAAAVDGGGDASSEHARVRAAAAGGHLAPDGGLAVRGALLQLQPAEAAPPTPSGPLDGRRHSAAAPPPPPGLIAWAADWQHGALVVLALMAGSHDAAAALLGAAQSAARALRLSRVVVWEPTDGDERRALRLHALPGAVTVRREGKLPMAKMAAPAASQPPPRLVGLQRVHWW
jgi:GNAT superfamily N-acetyltransferase